MNSMCVNEEDLILCVRSPQLVITLLSESIVAS